MSSISIPAIVPAAGKSRRMGRPKPLLPFDGQPLIGRVVSALRLGGASPVLVVTPPAQAVEGPPIAEAARQAGAAVITPAHWPAEMRESAETRHRTAWPRRPAQRVHPAPGDTPGITPEIVRRLLERSAQAPGSIVIPRAAGRRTHPIVLPWDLARQIPTLPRHQGINALMTAHPEHVIEIEVAHPELADELNTPEDLELAATSQVRADHPSLCRGQRAGRTSRDRDQSSLANDRRRSSPGPCLATPRARRAGSERLDRRGFRVCNRCHAHPSRRPGGVDPSGQRGMTIKRNSR